MLHSEAIPLLSKAFNNPLPGTEAQFKMAPVSRGLTYSQELLQSARPSAVALVLFPINGFTHLLYIKRSDYNGVHSSQIAFPGGKKDETDDSLLSTALRELEEEVGINSLSLTFLGELTSLYIPVSKFMVHPHVFYSKTELRFVPNVREVQEIIPFPISKLITNKIVGNTEIKLSNGLQLPTPYFDINGNILWGATAMISSEFRELLFYTNPLTL